MKEGSGGERKEEREGGRNREGKQSEGKGRKKKKKMSIHQSNFLPIVSGL